MNHPTPHTDAISAIACLRKDRQAMPWPQRRALVKSVAEQLEQTGPTEPAIALLALLADDPKWEVRTDVADCLLLVPDDDFPRLLARLSEDNNAFVRQAAQRTLDRRRRGKESDRRKRRGLDHVQDEYHNIEQTHGSVAAERARAMAERLYDVLVGAAVHDMRNILAPLKSSITGLLGHLADGKIDPGLLNKRLAKMGRQVGMIERMLEDMRTYAQPTPTERRRERLADIVKEAHVSVLDTFHATGRDAACVTASIDVPENLTIDVARFQMVRALTNLIKNAYEAYATEPQVFTPGVVYVTAKQCEDGYVEMVFRDHGMGLSSDELDEVRRFVPGGTSKKTHGTGFGLPIAKRKIEDHGGSLAIDSKEGKGTTVTVTLPIECGGNEE